MSSEASQQAVLCTLHFVDADESPYRAAIRSLPREDIATAFHGTANSALRQARERVDGIWFVSMELPDLSGPQLVEMLVGLSGHKLMVAMGNTYAAEEEAAALSSGASQYFVKPLAEELCWGVIESFLNLAAATADRNEAAVYIHRLSIECNW